MVVLTEGSLNKRHQEFNRKVAEAVESHVKFDDVKAEGGDSDINKLFKVDLASKYKNIDYIIETLKFGDSLAFSRVLKCTWIFGSDYSHIINPQFISDTLFPHLSLKSKKKLLTAISIHVRDEQRALEFYNFCTSLKYCEIAYKFLLFTSEEMKIKLLRENCWLIRHDDSEYFKHFIGKSLTFAKKYLEIIPEDSRRKVLYNLRYLYSHPDVGAKYLDLLETYEDPDKVNWYPNFQEFGLRMSKDIILKHKDRIYRKPLLYTNLLKKSMFVRYSTVEDAKYYTTALMPHSADAFWRVNYYENKRYFFDIIPMDEKYQFIKKLFNDKYPGVPFEMTINFYKLQYYNMIVDLELKEEWALRHVASEKEILGPGKDFLWYRFVKFDKAFEEIKKYIRINTDPDVRAEITNVLIESARNDRELQTLFQYYYERHINEERFRKERFLDAVNIRHNIFRFDPECFAALDKIYYSLEIYNVLTTFYCKSEYSVICLVYRIINKMEMPEAMIKFMDTSVPFYTLKCYNEKLLPEQVPFVINYLLEFFLKRINSFNDKPYDDSIKRGVRKYIHFVLDLMHQYEKPKEEIPEIVIKYVNLDWEEFKFHFYYRTTSEKPLSEADLLRCMKRDTSEFISKLPILEKRFKENYPLRVNHILRKLRVYFSNDLAIKCLNLYKNILNEPNLAKPTVYVIVYGIIHLADIKYLHEFITKHVPSNAKIDHVTIDRKVLSIQSAICSLAGYARPPVPLSLMLKYIKGDYTQYCLPLFNMYLANLKPEPCTEFVRSIVDAPLSVQKHGLRLAFTFFPVTELSELVKETWRRTKNVSLRVRIYKALHDKILQSEPKDALMLFDILNHFTSTVYEEDNHELFCLLTSDTLPHNMRNEHLKKVWTTFDKLPFKVKFVGYKEDAAKCLEHNMHLIEPQTFIEDIVKEHIDYVFDSNRDEEIYKLLKDNGLIRTKWQLTAKYLTFLKNRERVEEKLNLTKFIISKCIKEWNVVVHSLHVYRNFFREFLNLLKSMSYSHDVACYRHANTLFEVILKDLTDELPVEEIYQLIWDLKLNIRTRNIIVDAIDSRSDENEAGIIKEAGFKLGKYFVALVSEYIAKNMFWIMFYDDIQNSITHEAQNIANRLDGHRHRVQGVDIVVLVCKELTEVKRFETFFFASKMLHTPYDWHAVYGPEYRQTLDTLKSYEDAQIKCFVYQKFIRNNNHGSTLI